MALVNVLASRLIGVARSLMGYVRSTCSRNQGSELYGVRSDALLFSPLSGYSTDSQAVRVDPRASPVVLEAELLRLSGRAFPSARRSHPIRADPG